jgi:hypothetical protein
MYYTEFLRVRKAVICLAITIGVLLVIHAAIHLFVPAASSQSSGSSNFVALFAGTSLVIGGIMATIFGTALARENDGHLELAWTKPYSRTQYSTAAMLVDAAGIMFSVLMAFAALVLTLYTPGMRESVTWNLSASAVNDLLRFALFPLAWYGVIVASSARLRGGGLVQGLIWPVAIVLLALSQIPFPPVWHALFGALNIVNPLSYVEYKSGSVSMLAATVVSPATYAVVALAAFVVGGWALATIQWRRLEA